MRELRLPPTNDAGTLRSSKASNTVGLPAKVRALVSVGPMGLDLRQVHPQGTPRDCHGLPTTSAASLRADDLPCCPQHYERWAETCVLKPSFPPELSTPKPRTESLGYQRPAAGSSLGIRTCPRYF